MGLLEFYGATPDYGELYYNLHSETGQCLEEIDQRLSAERLDPLVLASDEPILSRKVVLNALKLRSARRRSGRLNVVWLDVFENTHAEVFWGSVRASIVEVWLGLQSSNISFFERRLISAGATPNGSEGELRAQTGHILEQMSGAEIVFIVDVRNVPDIGTALQSIIAGFDELLRQPTNNPLAVVVLGPSDLIDDRQLRAWGCGALAIALPEEQTALLVKALSGTEYNESGFSQLVGRSRKSHDANVEDAAASLMLVGEPVLSQAADYLASISAERSESLSLLLREGAVERLRNGGIALTNIGADKYRVRAQRSSRGKRALIEANSAHLLSALPPRRLRAFDGSPAEMDEALSPGASIIEPVAACLAARVARSTTLAGSLGKRIIGLLRDGEAILEASQHLDLDNALKYLSLTAFREPALFDRDMFKLAEEMTYALNRYDALADAEGTHRLQAQRITRLAHLFDHAPQGVRDRIGTADTKRYSRQAIAALDRGAPYGSPLDAVHAGYLVGWLHRDLGEHAAASKRMSEAAAISMRAVPWTGSINPLQDRSVQFELAVQAAFFSKDPADASARSIVSGCLTTTGIVVSWLEMSRLGEGGGIGRKALPARHVDPRSRWHLIFTRYDFACAAMIASMLLFDLERPVELVCVPDGANVDAVLKPCPGRKVVLGGPDTPGAIGDWIKRVLPDVAELWQLRFNESFFQPVLVPDEGGSPIVVLVASIVGDGLRAWTKLLLEMEHLKKDRTRPMDLAMFGSILPTILTTGSKKLTELFIDRLVKSIEGRLDPDRRHGVQGDLQDVRRVMETASRGGDIEETRARLSKGLDKDAQSRLVLTGVLDATDDRALYAQLETVLTDLASLDESTEYYRDMAALLRVLGLREHQASSGSLDRARKAMGFADGFSNLKSRLDEVIDDYETKAKWDVVARNKTVNELVATGARFFRFVRRDNS